MSPFIFFCPLNAGVVLEKRYKVLELINTEINGAFYKVFDEKSGSIYNLKEILPPYVPLKEQQNFLDYFIDTANLLVKLQHINLSGIIDCFISNGRCYLVMNFSEGKNLREILLKYGDHGIMEEQVIKWSLQLLDVLSYLHNNKPPLICGNINPDNILINKEDLLILQDFGFAAFIYGHGKNGNYGAHILNNRYASPEQWKGVLTCSSDIYSTGALMYHLLSGIEPYPLKFNFLKKYAPSVSIEMENIVMKALSEESSLRFSSAREMLEELTFKLIIEPRKIKSTSMRPGEWLPVLNIKIEKFYGVFFVDVSNGWIIGRNGVILATRDGGATWITQNSGVSEGLIGVYFVNKNNGWVVGAGQTLLSTCDGGDTWTVQVIGRNEDIAFISIHFVNNNRGWIAGWKGTIYCTVDGGIAWEKQESGVFYDLEDVFFINENEGWIVGWGGTILHTGNGGKNWEVQESGVMECLTGVHFIDKEKGWVVGWKGIILHTRDGGITWKTQKSNVVEYFTAISFIDINTGWIAGWNGRILFTTDGGNTWELVE